MSADACARSALLGVGAELGLLAVLFEACGVDELADDLLASVEDAFLVELDVALVSPFLFKNHQAPTPSASMMSTTIG